MLVERSPRCAPVQTERINAALFALFLETLRGPDLHLTPGDGSVPREPRQAGPCSAAERQQHRKLQNTLQGERGRRQTTTLISTPGCMFGRDMRQRWWR
eukprot:superscaffoldBa00004024_g18128